MTDRDTTLDELQLHRIRLGAVIARVPGAAYEVTGSGAVECLQGLLTNDVATPGPDSAVFGALLTPKGMVLTDMWTLRRQSALTLLVPPGGAVAAAEVFRRSLPPRLARVADLSEEVDAAWMLGDQALEVLQESALRPIPDGPGRLVEYLTPQGPLWIARPQAQAPFQVMIAGARAAVDRAVASLQTAGAIPGEPADLEAARILAGWPALGAEIDEKTLPQEVRFDEIGGLSYTKGCYIGQETVARLHFRGHPNRELRGLVWEEPGPLDGRVILLGDKEVGTVRSTLVFPHRRLGLAPVRREVSTGDEVTAGGRPARVVALPFEVLPDAA